jgi:catechol 2,3-dioxygenase-like lactoylglutathione lyase family enzyme
MSSRAPVDCEKYHAALAAPDVQAAIDFYTSKLGFFLAFAEGDPPVFAGVNFGHIQFFLRKDEPSPRGISLYFVVDDADELFAFHRSNGVTVYEEPEDRYYGIRDYTVRDLNGYYLTFGHHIFNAGPKIKIERVDVSVRLEKRLAALLEDLAKHKRMSVSSCLEEILLRVAGTISRPSPRSRS